MKIKILLILLNKKYGLTLGEFDNTSGPERVNFVRKYHKRTEKNRGKSGIILSLPDRNLVREVLIKTLLTPWGWS